MSRGYREKGRRRKGEDVRVSSFSEERILQVLAGEAGRPLTARELADELGVPRKDHRSMRGALDRMVDRGRVIKIKGGRFALPSRVHLVTGRLQITGLGDGLVIPDKGEGKVSVPHSQLGGAMHEDTVVVRVERHPSGRRHSLGRVIRVVKRARRQVVATYEEDEGIGMALPQDDRIGPPVLIPPGREGGAAPGSLVLVSLTSYPERGRSPRGEITEVLGDPDTLEAQTQAVIHAQGLPHRFPRKVSSEAAALPSEPRVRDLEGREDLRSL
ncbi:MAG: hypothetical protein JSV00_00275, partial [bacterium]